MAKLDVGPGMHTGTPCACDGIDHDYLRPLANDGHKIAAKSVDGTASLMDFQRLIQAGAEGIGVYRVLEGYDVPNYGQDIPSQVVNYINRLNEEWPPELDKELFYVELINEVDKNESDWIGWFMCALAQAAMDNGYRFCGPGWSSGEPEREHWETSGMLAYLQMCEANPGDMAVAVHEYAYDYDMFHEEVHPWNMGRVALLNQVCFENGIELPDVFITEFGWSYNQAPNVASGVSQIIKMLEWYIEYAPNVKAFFLWCLDRSDAWGNLPDKINSYMKPLAAAIMAKDWKVPVIPDIPDPEGPNVLSNGGFDNRNWTDVADQKQQPYGWRLTWTPVGETVPSGRFVATATSECVHKFFIPTPPDTKPTLPPNQALGGTTEHKTWEAGTEGLILDDPNCIKLFTTGQWHDRLAQSKKFKPDTTYMFSGYIDVHWHGYPAGDNPPENEDVVIQLECNKGKARYISDDFPDQTWRDVSIEGKSDSEGNLNVSIDIEVRWAHPRTIFLESFSVKEKSIIPDPLPKIVIMKLSQDHTQTTWGIASQYAFENYKRTQTASHDDMLTMLGAGNKESYAIIVDPERPSQQQSIMLLKSAGLNYIVTYIEDQEPKPIEDLFVFRPCQTQLVTQVFGANPDRYAQYDLPGHDGIDYGAGQGQPYYAVQDGVVVHASNLTNAGNPSAYGYHVIIGHEVEGQVFHTVYAHAQSSLPVAVGQHVLAGHIVGRSGNSGNTTGYHLHFGLLWPESVGNGYPQWRFGYAIDPWPFLEGRPAPRTVDPAPKYDMLPYLRGDGRLYEVGNSDGGQERLQSQIVSANEFLQTKNHNGEQFFFDQSYILRGWDTSPSEDTFYQQQQPKGADRAQWIPRFMGEEEKFVVSLYLASFHNNCSLIDSQSGHVTDTRIFVKHHDHWVSRFGIEVPNVIQLEWVNGGETYFYGKFFGLVGWERTHQDPNTPQWSSISEVHQPGQRPDNAVKIPDCLKDGIP